MMIPNSKVWYFGVIQEVYDNITEHHYLTDLLLIVVLLIITRVFRVFLSVNRSKSLHLFVCFLFLVINF